MAMLNRLGLPRVKIWQEKLLTSQVARLVQLLLTCRCLFLADTVRRRARLTRAYLTRATVQLLFVVIFAHAVVRRIWGCYRGVCYGGALLESGAWWRVEFDACVRNQLRQRVKERDELSINVLGLLGMVMIAWAFIF